MADIQHSAIPDGQRHEPKGASTATAKQVYVADGAASGAWTKLQMQSLYGVAANGDANQVVVSDGAGGFSLIDATAHGSIYFFDSATPYTWTYSATFTKVAATTTAGGGADEMTEATTSRITYTGTLARRAHIQAQVSIKQASGTAKDISIAIAKNGTVVAESETIVTSTTSQWTYMASLVDTAAATNDYWEVFMKNGGGAGNVDVAGLRLIVDAHA